MREVIQIKEGVALELLANASTPIRYNQLFHEDLLKSLTALTENTGTDTVEIVNRLAYVMRMQATGQTATMSMNDYLNWLEQFDAFDLFGKSEEIIGVYVANLKGGVNAKKNSVR